MTIKLWRKFNIPVKTKASLLEHHSHYQLKEFKGIIYREEYHIKREQPVDSPFLTLTRSIKRYYEKTHTQLKTMEIAGNSEK